MFVPDLGWGPEGAVGGWPLAVWEVDRTGCMRSAVAGARNGLGALHPQGSILKGSIRRLVGDEAGAARGRREECPGGAEGGVLLGWRNEKFQALVGCHM